MKNIMMIGGFDRIEAGFLVMRRGNDEDGYIEERYPAIEVDLTSLSTGFNPVNMVVCLPKGKHVAVETDSGIIAGWSADVARRMARDGWQIDAKSVLGDGAKQGCL